LGFLGLALSLFFLFGNLVVGSYRLSIFTSTLITGFITLVSGPFRLSMLYKHIVGVWLSRLFARLGALFTWARFMLDPNEGVSYFSAFWLFSKESTMAVLGSIAVLHLGPSCSIRARLSSGLELRFLLSVKSERNLGSGVCVCTT
jgi:hypothetical protein